MNYELFFESIDNRRIDNRRIDNRRIDNRRIDNRRIDNRRVYNRRVYNRLKKTVTKKAKLQFLASWLFNLSSIRLLSFFFYPFKIFLEITNF